MKTSSQSHSPYFVDLFQLFDIHAVNGGHIADIANDDE